MGCADASRVYAKYEKDYLGRTSQSTLWGSLFFTSKMPTNASLKGLRDPLTHDDKSIVDASESLSERYAYKERELLDNFVWGSNNPTHTFMAVSSNC